jgi:hypothetical protein
VEDVVLKYTMVVPGGWWYLNDQQRRHDPVGMLTAILIGLNAQAMHDGQSIAPGVKVSFDKDTAVGS